MSHFSRPLNETRYQLIFPAGKTAAEQSNENVIFFRKLI